MIFQPLSYDNRKNVSEYFTRGISADGNTSSNITCDLLFGTTFLWRDYYSTTFSEIDGAIILQTKIGGTPMFSVPFGSTDICRTLRAVGNYAHENGITLYFCFVPESCLPYFHEAFDIVFASEEPDWCDYVYDFESLKDFPGRSYHGQKNHLNKFKKLNPNSTFCRINADNKESVKVFVSKWYGLYSDNSLMSQAEEHAVYDYLDNLQQSGELVGGFITANDGTAGFAVGEIVGDTVFIHIEKADHTIPGAYQFLQSEFLRSISDVKIKYVNREEDMGIQGLRRAKEALHPVKILKKYTLYCC